MSDSHEIKEKNAQVYTWYGYAEEEGVHSLLKYIDTYGDRLRSKYLAFIYDLGESLISNKRIIDHLKVDDFSIWWMSLFVEKSSFKSPRILDCFRVLALEELVQKSLPKKIVLNSSDKLVIETIKDLCANYQITFEHVSKGDEGKSFSLRKFFDNLPYFLQGLIYLARHILTRWSLRQTGIPKWNQGEDSVFLFSNFFNLDLILSEKGKFHSRQWEELPEHLLNNGVKTNLVHHFLYSPDIKNSKDAAKIMNRYNSNAQSADVHAFLDTFLTINVFFTVLLNWFRLFFKVQCFGSLKQNFTPKNSKVSLWSLCREDWYTTTIGKAGMMNLIWARLFNDSIKSLPKQKLGIYLCENQDWERAFVHYWRKYQKSELVAVAHSTIRFWDLRYFLDKRSINQMTKDSIPLPDKMAINGPLAKNMMIASGYPGSSILEVEALRYQYLKNFSAASVKTHSADPSLLILGNFTYDQTVKMIQCLDSANKYVSQSFHYGFKPHPVCAIPLKQYTQLPIDVTNEPLLQVVSKFQMAFSSNTTSAGLDAYLAGLAVAVYLDDKDFNFSPLREFKDVDFVSTPDELGRSLNRPKDKNLISIEEVFWLDAKLSRWNSFLKEKKVI